MTTLRIGVMDAMKLGGFVLAVIGILSLVYLFVFTQTFASRLMSRYTGYMDRSLRFLFRPGSGKAIAGWQGGLIAAVLGVHLVLVDVPYWYAMVALTVVGPVVYLRGERSKRIAHLELQVDGFILALANSMKTVPSPSAALQAIVPILHNPTRQEVERVVAEMRVGNTLEQGLLNMSARIGSRTIDSALSSVLVGLQVGGNLPTVLETTASTIREMNRLDGVVKTKTSEGRAQLWVLAIFPFAICGAFNWVSPGYFDILQRSFAGYCVMAIAMICWVASLMVARKVLTVDI
jgi:tight adherence protein B